MKMPKKINKQHEKNRIQEKVAQDDVYMNSLAMVITCHKKRSYKNVILEGCSYKFD